MAHLRMYDNIPYIKRKSTRDYGNNLAGRHITESCSERFRILPYSARSEVSEFYLEIKVIHCINTYPLRGPRYRIISLANPSPQKQSIGLEAYSLRDLIETISIKDLVGNLRISCSSLYSAVFYINLI